MQLTSNNLCVCVGFEVGIIILYIWLRCRFWRLEDDNRVLIFGLFMHYALKCMYNVDSQTCYRVYLHIQVQLLAVYTAYTTLYIRIETYHTLPHLLHSLIWICEEEHHQHEPQVYHALIFSFRQKETEKNQNSKCPYLLEKICWTLKTCPKNTEPQEVWLHV